MILLWEPDKFQTLDIDANNDFQTFLKQILWLVESVNFKLIHEYFIFIS